MIPDPPHDARIDLLTMHRFVARGAASPDFPLRILDLFAQRDLCFEHVKILRRADCYFLIIEQAGLSSEQANILLNKMRSMVLLAGVRMRPFDRVGGRPLAAR